MDSFKVHSIESAPEKSKPMLEDSVKGFGMLPNLHGVMAESPAMLEAYKTVHGIFSQKTSFNADELTVVWQTINVANECHYCVPAHTAIAHSMDVSADITNALRSKQPLADAKLEALRQTTLAVINKGGKLSSNDMNAFFDAGYTPAHYLDILVGYSQKVMSNYTNYVAETAVDEPFQKFAWDKATA